VCVCVLGACCALRVVRRRASIDCCFDLLCFALRLHVRSLLNALIDAVLLLLSIKF
jgi:hypothetical protein